MVIMTKKTQKRVYLKEEKEDKGGDEYEKNICST